MDEFVTTTQIWGLISGQSAALIALFGWLGHVWAKRISNKEQARANADLTELKTEFDGKLAALNAGNESKVHVSKIQYEREFSSYAKIWDLVSPTAHQLQILFTHKKSYEFFKMSFLELGKIKVELGSEVNSLYPFIDENVYQKSSKCSHLLQKYWHQLDSHLNYLEKKANGEVAPSTEQEDEIGKIIDEATVELHNASVDLAKCIRARNEEMVVSPCVRLVVTPQISLNHQVRGR